MQYLTCTARFLAVVLAFRLRSCSRSRSRFAYTIYQKKGAFVTALKKIFAKKNKPLRACFVGGLCGCYCFILALALLIILRVLS